MGIKERPVVTVLENGGKCWEHEYEKFYLKAYLPATEIDGQVNNYSFIAPFLVVFEENKQSMSDAIKFADESGLAEIASNRDAAVVFVYPTCEGGWKNATVDLYADLIAEVRMDPTQEDGIVAFTNFFDKEFKGYFIRAAKFRTDIYSFGESADYVAKNLLDTVKGEYLWGPGEIQPAMCSMERLSVAPIVKRKDIAIVSVGNSDDINASFKECEHLLIKESAEYKKDFYDFVWKFKMWCNVQELEPDFEAMNMTLEPGCVTVKTSADNQMISCKDEPEHKVGYFAYYNKDVFDNGPAPLVLAFHGGGDSALYITFTANLYAVAHRHNFVCVAIENHLNVPAGEVMQVLEEVKKRYNIDEKRIYAGGFSMGCVKTWDLFQEFPNTFAGFMPCSALFPLTNNQFSPDLGDRLNKTVSVPLFYSGGEDSPLPELPNQAPDGIERVQYLFEVNKVKEDFDIKYEEKDSWEDPIWGKKGDRVEKLYNPERDSYLTVHYFDSEDGVCRTALASVSNQQHECREHSIETAWNFVSQFTLD